MGKSNRARGIAGVVGAAVPLAGLWLFLKKDAYIVDAVETYGTASLGTKVSLRGAHLDVARQSLELRGLVVANPPGYHGDDLLRLESVKVALDASTLASDVVVIRELQLLRPEITYEKVEGVANVDVLQRNADRYARDFGDAPSPGAKISAPKRWIIEDVEVRGAKALVVGDLVVARSLNVPVPNVHLRNIGKRTHGATTADATQQVLEALTASVGNAVGSAVAGAAKTIGHEVGKGLQSLGGALHGLFER
jgi:hypothetical protein